MQPGQSPRAEGGTHYAHRQADRRNSACRNVVPRLCPIGRLCGFYFGEVSILPLYTHNEQEIKDAGFNALDRNFLRTSLSMTASTDSGSLAQR